MISYIVFGAHIQIETYRVVKFMVNVKLMEKSVNNRVGNVMVTKVIIQYRTLGTVWKTKVNHHPIHPAIVEGAGGNDVGREAATALEAAIGEVEGAVRLRARDGARPAMTKTRLESAPLCDSEAPNSQKNLREPGSNSVLNPNPTVGPRLSLVDQKHRKRAGSFTGGWMKCISRL